MLATAPPRPPLADERPFTPAPGEEVSTKVPWHFWLLVLAVVVYLGWRLVQLVQWLVR